MINLFTAYVASHIESLSARRSDDEGASAVEYGLLVGLIAVAIIVVVALLGRQLDALFLKVTNALAGPSGVAV